MAMTGKYGGTSDAVVVSADLEAALLARLPSGASYDSNDVLFYAVSDGIVVEVPITGGALPKYVLNFSDLLLTHPQQFLIDLKVIRDAVTAEEITRKAKVAALYAA
jgi:hypothetical protein